MRYFSSLMNKFLLSLSPLVRNDESKQSRHFICPLTRLQDDQFYFDFRCTHRTNDGEKKIFDSLSLSLSLLWRMIWFIQSYWSSFNHAPHCSSVHLIIQRSVKCTWFEFTLHTWLTVSLCSSVRCDVACATCLHVQSTVKWIICIDDQM